MKALEVRGAGKRYPAFTLSDVTFSVEEGKVCGLIGANGAGKSTLLSGIAGLIGCEGEISVCGHSLRREERAAKACMGFAGGGFRYYADRTVEKVARAVAPFYPVWDGAGFLARLSGYGISPAKRIASLSEGMKVKLFLSLALSHGARLLILDEPTSGLDPLSREELCAELLHLAREEGVAVLFSTHITSDLVRTADDVVFLSRGKVVFKGEIAALRASYRIGYFADAQAAMRAGAIGIHAVREGVAGLLAAGACPQAAAMSEGSMSEASLDDIMVCMELEERKRQ